MPPRTWVFSWKTPYHHIRCCNMQAVHCAKNINPCTALRYSRQPRYSQLNLGTHSACTSHSRCIYPLLPCLTLHVLGQLGEYELVVSLTRSLDGRKESRILSTTGVPPGPGASIRTIEPVRKCPVRFSSRTRSLNSMN
jgi:hypothetical protein